MRRLAAMTLAFCLMTAAQTALAIDMTPPLPNATLQQRYYDLTHELRCMQCQNESLADSNVSLAADLRLKVRELLVAGNSDEQIREHLVARYSEFILFRPRMNWRNAWLWSAPAVLLIVGLLTAVRVMRQRAALVAGDDSPLDEPPAA